MKLNKDVVFCYLALLCLWLTIAYFLPLTQDEAYYASWCSHLSFGYFDHPPAVALLGCFYRWSRHHFFARLGIILVMSIVYFILVSFFKKTRTYNHFPLGPLLFFFTSFLGIAGGILLTPDTPLILCWLLSLYFAYKALIDKQAYHFLSWGFFTGLGLLSKYTMFLMLPLIGLWILLFSQASLKKPQFWLGIAIAFGVFFPNIKWNAEHNWISYRFQLKHGFGLERDSNLNMGFLELKAKPEYQEKKLVDFYTLFYEKSAKPSPAPTPIKKLLRPINRLSEFVIGQIVLLGAHSFILLFLLFKTKVFRRQKKVTTVLSPTQIFFAYCGLVPLVVFAILSLLAKVEANWSAMYLVGLVLFMGTFSNLKNKYFYIPALANTFIILVLLGHNAFNFLPLKSGQDRLRRETLGFRELSQYIDDQGNNLYTETYQLTAMLKHYSQTNVTVGLWPGLTRPSQYNLSSFAAPSPILGSNFQLLLAQFPPPFFLGYQLHKLSRVEYCQDTLRVINAKTSSQFFNPCKKLLMRWYFAEYYPSS